MHEKVLSHPREFLDEMMRRDYGFFLQMAFFAIEGGKALAWNWHLDAIAYALQRVSNGQDRRLVVTMPPRNLKSIAISVAWVAWLALDNAEQRDRRVAQG